jgi:kinesin family protein 6/9
MSVVTAVAAVDSPKARTPQEDDSWAIATYLRLKPTYLPPSKDIEYDIQDIQLADGTRSVVELAIPPDADPGLVHNNSATGTLRYEFDRIFDTSATQEQVFDAVAREKIQGVLDGFSCTIFAYGQTGSGKTYTIFGGDSFKERGLIPR